MVPIVDSKLIALVDVSAAVVGVVVAAVTAGSVAVFAFVAMMTYAGSAAAAAVSDAYSAATMSTAVSWRHQHMPFVVAVAAVFYHLPSCHSC